MKVAFVLCGTLSASHFPLHASWIRHNYPNVIRTVVLTKSALRFVTTQSIRSILECVVLEDDWDSFLKAGTNHVKFGEDHDVIIVYPGSVDYIRRLSELDFSTPTTAAIASGTAQIIVCPSLPPGISEHPESQRHREKLIEFPRMSVINPVEGQSLSSVRPAFVPPPIWEIWDQVFSIGGC
jgi:phosphopantothenoylcysteine synthetase/decarboxylase